MTAVTLYFIIPLLLFILSVTVYNACTAPLIKNGPSPSSVPLVSALVPARNEGKTIRRCLEDLSAQDYPNLEIRVLDDGSQDDTAAIVRRMAEKDSRLQLRVGAPLPQGWTGKNWACHQLSCDARGEIFLFTDADNFYHPCAISHTVGWMQKLHLSLVSAFPQQITRTLAEKMIVPVFDMFVYSYLPLWLTYRAPQPSLAAANGQWIAVTKEAYQKLGGHASVRHHIVEDVQLSRLAKKIGLKILTASGTDEVKGHMYHSWNEVWRGFSKNAFGLVAHKTIPFMALLTVMSAVYIMPYIFVWFETAWVPSLTAIAINVLIRAILALKYKQPFWVSILLHPFSILMTILIGLNSYRCFKNGKTVWKGREVYYELKDSVNKT